MIEAALACFAATLVLVALLGWTRDHGPEWLIVLHFGAIAGAAAGFAEFAMASAVGQ